MRDWNSLFLNVGILFAVAIVMVVAFFVARRVRARMISGHVPPPFTLQDLREMKATGQITEEEFNAMRSALMGAWTDASPRRGSQPPRRPSPSDPDDGLPPGWQSF